MKVEETKKYILLKLAIIDYIRKHRLKKNDRLPTVQEIIKKYKFSYATVNRTLIELENEGIITKHQGKGIYVGSGKTEIKKCVGLIIPTPVSEYKMFADILNGIKTVLEKANYTLLISISNMNHQLESENVMQMVERKIDGLIIFMQDYYRHNFSHISYLKKKKYPFVLIDRYIPDLDTDYVVVNNKDILYRICSYLKYSRSCEKIFFVPDPTSTIEITATEDKITGYLNAVSLLYGKGENNIIKFVSLIKNLKKYSSGYSNFGVVFNHDALVLEFKKEVKKKYGRLPENCHLFGYNNSHSPWEFPTVEQFNDRIGSEAAKLLIERIENPLRPAGQILVDAKMILPDGKNNFKMEK